MLVEKVLQLAPSLLGDGLFADRRSNQLARPTTVTLQQAE